MRNITAKTVFNHMAPSTLVDFITSLPFNIHPPHQCVECALVAELRAAGYTALVVNVGQQEADDMLEEKES